MCSSIKSLVRRKEAALVVSKCKEAWMCVHVVFHVCIRKPKCVKYELSIMRRAAGVAPHVSPFSKLRCLCATSSEQVRDRSSSLLGVEVDSLLVCFVSLKSK